MACFLARFQFISPDSPATKAVTLQIKRSGQDMYACITGHSYSAPVFTVECKLKPDAEWVRDCMASFKEQMEAEGFLLNEGTSESTLPAQPAKKADLTLHDISAFFHLPVKAAASCLGVSQTYLKILCRRLGIDRWPYRKVASVKKHM
uniref:MID n=2 Tax=Chlamydomonas reinhardtii TaxID=3055 RepID=O04101_CHLRE|nr:minus dominance protein [Chlamydomonas reinhardtii]ABC86961.1 MID [Chlamydomonas reinhardtii]ABC86962.1 MID [Chlamydomonas reinhardtii]ABC86963.1 MID [Chlamydomonas reinhardtii]ABC86964.1 MID [Chlamydomonas reinhardtii]